MNAASLPGERAACVPEVKAAPSARRWMALATLATGIGLLLFAPSGYFRYSVIGFGYRQFHEEAAFEHYYRLRWPGDGTLRCGGGLIRHPHDKRFDRLDLAGRLWTQARPHRHRAAHCGFGYWHGAEEYDSKEGEHVWARWVSVPAWLPGVLFLVLGIAFYWRLLRQQVRI